MAENSPTWRKPSEIMSLRRKRKSSITPRRTDSNTSASPSSTESQSVNKRMSQKRRNPFGCSPRKKANLGDKGVGSQSSYDSNLLNILGQSQNQEDQGKTQESCPMQNLDEILKRTENSGDTSTATQPEKEADISKEVAPGTKMLPVDWSLKTKARFVSPQPFTWCTPLKTCEESSGVTAFTCAHQDLVNQPTETANPSDAAKTDVQKHTLYWQHPNLPWFKPFPRIVSDHKLGKAGSLVLTEDAQQALMADWTESFISVFTQLRGGKCPYFYVCAHQFTVLFRAAGVCGKPFLHALLTPTSRGIRESLRKEGIEFQLPLVASTPAAEAKTTGSPQMAATKTDLDEDEAPSQPVEKSGEEDSSIRKTTNGEDEEELDDIVDTDEGASSWLETLGLDRRHYRSLDPNKVKLQRESFRAIDHRAESLVYVEGGDTNALFNFLLNCRSCVASSGPQAGLPPTLLAPGPFKGATLKTLKLKTSIVRQKEPGTPNWFGLEVMGALLPHHVHGLTRLFSHTQSDFTVTFNSHDPTAPLNSIKSAADSGQQGAAEGVTNSCDHQGAAESLTTSGIQACHAAAIVEPSPLGKFAIKDSTCQKGQFTWTL